MKLNPKLIEDTGWIDLVLQNGTTQRNGNQYKPQVRRIGKIVYMKGQVNIPAHTSDIAIANIPLGYRPAWETIMPAFNGTNWIDTKGVIWVGVNNTATTNQKIYSSWTID